MISSCSLTFSVSYLTIISDTCTSSCCSVCVGLVDEDTLVASDKIEVTLTSDLVEVTLFASLAPEVTLESY